MGFIKKDWTPQEADQWTLEDTITVIISPVIYILILTGGALSALLIQAGFLLLAIALLLIILMVKIINPKLSAISKGYELKQKEYLEELEKKVNWED